MFWICWFQACFFRVTLNWHCFTMCGNKGVSYIVMYVGDFVSHQEQLESWCIMHFFRVYCITSQNFQFYLHIISLNVNLFSVIIIEYFTKI